MDNNEIEAVMTRDDVGKLMRHRKKTQALSAF